MSAKTRCPSFRLVFSSSCVSGLLFVLAVTLHAAEPVELYQQSIKPLLKSRCVSCHGPLKQEGGLRLDSGELVRKGSESGPVIKIGSPVESELLRRVTSNDEADRMPPEGERVTAEQLTLLQTWIAASAPSPADEKPLADPHQHWAFQPLNADPNVGSIDEFIKDRLETAELHLAPAADKVSLIRRLYMDMHGLPPTLEQVAAFLKDDSPEAWSKQIEEVLTSPRYGERWAQYWLDVVRYADTHGFEVNTPRDNAWPYRDYVIRALNDDKPYDQFVREQLAGDALHADPATGFLVAAAVLLPGQIGADDESKRLARQDSLDEIIVGTSGTFLGLTLGCSRCHDHKFDPLTQRDYYALQAFFAGVDYGDRVIRDTQFEERQQRLATITAELKAEEAKLEQLEPLVFPGRTVIIDDEDDARVTHLKQKNGHGENPEGTKRGYRDDPGSANQIGNLGNGRYTWWTNVPGEDVFTYQPQVSGWYNLWISWGAHGSGVHTRDARYVLDFDGDLSTKDDQTEVARVDQYYLAGISEGETEKQPLWSGMYNTGTREWGPNSKLILRGGDTGTGITADVIVLQEAVDKTVMFGPTPHLRSAVSPVRNVERFQRLEARFVRFTSFATINNNQHEPCFDELEVFGPEAPEMNLAAGSRGVKPTSSGDYPGSDRHKLEHINDGLYGNSKSWISNEHGQGWVQLELSEPVAINRIVWGRDREGKFADRLALDYQIDISLDGTEWTTVATDDDRLPFGTPDDPIQSRLRNVPQDAPFDVPALVERIQQLDQQQDKLSENQMVYGGIFRQPDETFVLRRGDPEQRVEQVAPAFPEFLEVAHVTAETEQQRRLALAEWITRPNHPLTARVMVNRIWQGHFGRGIVSTPSDFGMNGGRPSHPELLDWLAATFVKDGWSIKQLHRLILNSRTYQQSGRIDPAALQVDADCRLLWRYPSRRLSAESIRDSMLLVSGNLNLEMYGPGFNFFKSRGGLSGFPPVEEFTPNELRRMIYSHKIRMEQVPVFGAFDCPDAGQSMPKRSQSTTALQALNLFNSQFVSDQAEVFAESAMKAAGDDVSRQIDIVFRKALGREPNEAELRAATPLVEQHGLSALCRAVFNSNEFLFIP